MAIRLRDRNCTVPREARQREVIAAILRESCAAELR